MVACVPCAGAYTTARTVNGNLVFKLSSHIQRLATSANLMIDADMRVGWASAKQSGCTAADNPWPLAIVAFSGRSHLYCMPAEQHYG